MREQLSAIARFFQFSLLGLVASGYLAITGSGYVDAPTILLAGLGLIWRAAIILGFRKLQVPERAVTIATLAYMAFAPIDFFLISHVWIAATIHVVFFVAGVKVLTAKNARDYVFVAAVAFIELLAAALFSLSGTFFLCLTVYLFCAVAALAAAEVRRTGGKNVVIARGERSWGAWRIGVVSAMMTTGILALTAVLFFLLPRTANAAMHLFVSNRFHLTGFSNDVLLGEVGELKRDSRVVMRVKAYGRPIPPNLKWRGLALERFDGHRWSTDPASFRPIPRGMGGPLQLAVDWQRRRVGPRLLYKVDIQNVDADALFVAGIPEFVNVGQMRVARSDSGALRFGYVPGDTLSYEVVSYMGPPDAPSSEPHQWQLSMEERLKYLSLPLLDARIQQLAREMTRGSMSAQQEAEQLERHLRRDYAYSLDLPSSEPKDPIAMFLFDRRKGYCEYFASSMTVMLRLLGIPARLVNGFQSGVVNPYSGELVVRASDAHTWVEAFLPDQGWTVFDPTPPGAGAASESLWTKLQLYADAADSFWRDWVVSYDLGQQVMLAARVERHARQIRTTGLTGEIDALRRALSTGFTSARGAFGWRWAWTISLVPVALLVWLLLPWLRARGSINKARAGKSAPRDATVLYERMLLAMKRRGLQKPGWFTPEEFATSVVTAPLKLAGSADLERFTSAYYAVRFGDDAEAAREMLEVLDSL